MNAMKLVASAVEAQTAWDQSLRRERINYSSKEEEAKIRREIDERLHSLLDEMRQELQAINEGKAGLSGLELSRANFEAGKLAEKILEIEEGPAGADGWFM